MSGHTIEATTAEGVQLLALVRLVSGSSRLAERLEATSQQAVEEAIYWPDILNPEETQRPFVVIMEGDFSMPKIAGGQRNLLQSMGTLEILIADNAEHMPNRGASLIEFTNFAGGIIDDISECFGDGTNSLTDIERIGTHTLSDPTDSPGVRPWWWAQYQVRWNPIG